MFGIEANENGEWDVWGRDVFNTREEAEAFLRDELLEQEGESFRIFELTEMDRKTILIGSNNALFIEWLISTMTFEDVASLFSSLDIRLEPPPADVDPCTYNLLLMQKFPRLFWEFLHTMDLQDLETIAETYATN